jgi:hypothetical protein
MQRSKERFRELLLELAWSLWSEIGASGWTRRHQCWAIDPEPLIVFTAALRDADPRLRDESTDWCIRYGRYVSGARLRNLLKDEPASVRAAFGEYAATVNQHAEVRWPEAGEARVYKPTGRSRLDDFGRPALVSLRLRALFGVSTRAEIIRSFIASVDGQPTAADLAAEINYTKRNVEKELESLRLAGLLCRTAERNQLRYTLARRANLLDLVGPLPTHYPRWSSIFRLLLVSLEVYEQFEGLEPQVRAVEVRRTFRQLSWDLQRAGLGEPDPEATGEEVWPAFERWSGAVAGSLADAQLDAVFVNPERPTSMLGNGPPPASV